MLRYVLALLLIQAVPLAQPRYLHIAAMTQPPQALIPGTPGLGPHLGTAPSHLMPSQWFDGHARAALIVWRPDGYRIIVLRTNGQHVTQDFSDQTTSLEVSTKQ